MAKKFIYVGSDGFYVETPNAYESSDFIATTAGVTDATKPIVTDANGHVASSFIDYSGFATHSNLSGLSSDDHTQYILVAGTRAWTGNQSAGGYKITSLGTPTIGGDATNKTYVDGISAGLNPKASVRFSTKLDIAATYNSSGGTGTTGAFTAVNLTSATLFDLGASPITAIVGDRILVKNQTDAKQNGIYTITTAGASGAIERALDFDGTPAAEIAGGDFTYIQVGATYGGTKWVLVGDGTLTLNTSNIVWTQYAGPDTVVGGSGILVSGQTVSVDWATTSTDNKAWKASDLSAVTSGKGASSIGIVDAGSYITAVTIEGALTELETQIGGATSTTYTFTQHNYVANNDYVYPAINKLDIALKQEVTDLASQSNGKGASLIGIEDAGAYTAQTTVEGALQEIYGLISSSTGGVTYTTGTGGVTKGDLVYIGSNDHVLPYATITNSQYGIGLAYTTQSATTNVKVLSNDVVLAGVLTGATAGTKYYWNGTTYVSTRPSTSGAYVWQVGVAKNATDLHVEVQFIAKNA